VLSGSWRSERRQYPGAVPFPSANSRRPQQRFAELVALVRETPRALNLGAIELGTVELGACEVRVAEVGSREVGVREDDVLKVAPTSSTRAPVFGPAAHL
jgi:hypothetical protein